MNIRLLQPNTSAQISGYLKSLSKELVSSDFPLEKIDVRKLEGIQSDIPVFKDVSMPEIKFLTKNFSVLNIAQGCTNGCSHCLRNAQIPKQNASILWEDLTAFTDGFKKLNERLDFDVFKGNKWIALHDDANPPEITLKDNNGNRYNFFDVIENVFENLNLPIETVTSGWNPKDYRAQNAIKKIVNYFQTVPQANNLISVSFNPFHKLMEQSREQLKLGHPEHAHLYREFYIQRMAHSIKELLPLFKEGKATIIYRHAGKNAPDEVGAKETFNLYKTMYRNLKKLVRKEELQNIEILHPDNFATEKPQHLIEAKGRGRRFFSKEENLTKQQELIAEKTHWESISPAEKVDLAYKYTLKEVDISGKVFATTHTENFIPTEVNLNFNRSIPAPHKFSDVKLSELKKEDIIQNI